MKMIQDVQNNRSSRCCSTSKLGDKLLSLDQFGEGFTMKLTDGKDRVQTWMGTLCSIISLVIVATYTVQKLDILLHKKDVDIKSVIQENYFDTNEEFGGKQGFNVAVAFSQGFGDNQVIDETVLELKFKYWKKSVNEKSGFVQEYVEVDSHYCTPDELGLGNSMSKSKFMPIRENSRSALIRYQNSFKCLDQDTELRGFFSSDRGQNLIVEIIKCHDKVYCKTQEEIDSILQSSKLVLLKNEINFDQRKYGEESIISESAIDYIQIDQYNRYLSIYQVSKTELSLQNLLIDLDDLTLYENSSVFKVENTESRPWNSDHNFIFGISFSLNPNLQMIERTSFTVLDLLSAIGGIQSMVFSGISLLLSLWNYNFFDSFLVSQLYTMKSAIPSKQTTNIIPNKLSNFKTLCIRFLPNKSSCCGKNERKRIAMLQACSQLEKEIEIIELIRSIRFLYKAIDHMLSADVIQKLKEESKYIEIQSQEEESVEPFDQSKISVSDSYQSQIICNTKETKMPVLEDYIDNNRPTYPKVSVKTKQSRVKLK